MSRYNVEYDGKYACFSSVSEGFITPFMDKEDYSLWYKDEYDKIFKEQNVKSIYEAIFDISLNRTFDEALNCFKESGLGDSLCEELFYKMQLKYYKPQHIQGKKYRCPNCGQEVYEGEKECSNDLCGLEFFWGVNKNSKRVRLTIEFEIDEESCNEKDITKEDVFNSLCVDRSELVDGYVIYPVNSKLRPSFDFVLGTDAVIVKKEFVDKK